MELNEQLQLASSIKNLRLVNRYTQTQVADRLHMCRSAYALLESGKRNPTVSIILDLADIYGVDPEMIVDTRKTHIFDLIDCNDKYEKQVIQLVDIYHQLTPYTRGCLMERAEILLTTEAT